MQEKEREKTRGRKKEWKGGRERQREKDSNLSTVAATENTTLANTFQMWPPFQSYTHTLLIYTPTQTHKEYNTGMPIIVNGIETG